MEKHPAQSFFIPVLMFILAYEWLISSINKMVTKNYLQNLHQQMAQSVSGVQFQPYAHMLRNIGLPNYGLFGVLVLVAEAFVGIAFLAIGITKLRRRTSRSIFTVGIVASIIAAFMSLNYALLGGDTIFVDPSNAFQEGISIDWILFLVEVSLAYYFYRLAFKVNEAH